MRTPTDLRWTTPIYTLADAAALLRVPRRRVWRWYRGYSSAGRDYDPVVAPSLAQSQFGLEVSFLALAEGVVIGAAQNQGIPLRRIRAARAFARDRLEIDYPFASDVFRTDGARILYEFDSGSYAHPDGPMFVDVGNHAAQTTLEGFVTETFSLFTFADSGQDWVKRFHPAGQDVPLYVDPTIRAGQLVTEVDAIRAEAIWKRYRGGDEPDFIARDFGTGKDQVLAVIEFMTAGDAAA